jgi:hypothetical protein
MYPDQRLPQPQVSSPVDSMVPPPPDPTLDPESQQKAHTERGAMILTALKQLSAVGQQQQPVNPSDLIPDVGGAKGTAFMGSRLVQTKQEQQLRANMAAAQMNQQQQRDLMQKGQQEQARADQIGFQKMKFKNDMDLRKMEEQQKKAEREAEMNSPEAILRRTKAELELKQIQETGIQPDIEWNDALAWIKAGADPKEVAKTFNIPNEGLLTGVASRSDATFAKSQRTGTGGGSGGGGTNIGGDLSGLTSIEIARRINIAQEASPGASDDEIAAIAGLPVSVVKATKKSPLEQKQTLIDIVNQRIAPIAQRFELTENRAGYNQAIQQLYNSDPALQAAFTPVEFFNQIADKQGPLPTGVKAVKDVTDQQKEAAQIAAAGDSKKLDYILSGLKSNSKADLTKLAQDFDNANTLVRGSNANADFVVTLEDLQ